MDGGRQSATLRYGLPQGGVDAVDVFVVVELVEEGGDFFAVGFVEFWKRFGEVTDFRSGDVPASGFERFGDVIEILDLGDEARAFVAFGNFLGFERLDFLSSGFDRIAFGVAVRISVRAFNHAEMVEEKGDAARIAERASLENAADVGSGAVAVVGEAFDHERDFVGREAFVGDEFVVNFFVGETSTLFDGAFDGVSGHGTLARFLDGGGKACVQVGIGAAHFGGDHDFTDEFNDDLTALLRVGFTTGLFPLSTHGVK